MATTDKELDKLRSANDKLRDQIAAEEATRASSDADAAREIEAEQLKAEQARLEAQLNLAKAANAASKKGAESGPLQVAREAREAAEEQGKAQVEALKGREEEQAKEAKAAEEASKEAEAAQAPEGGSE